VRIAYITNVRLPSERAHGHQIAQVCDALGVLGHDVRIFCPFRKNVVTQDYWTYYGAREEVGIEYLGSFDPIASPLPGVTKLWVLNALLRRHLRAAIPRRRFDLLYTRSPALLPALLGQGAPVILELHQLPRFGRRAFVRRCNRCTLVACLTSAMRDTLARWGVDERRLMSEGDAVDLKRFKALPPAEEVRASLGLPKDRLVVGYVGRLKTLGMEKGVGILLEALAALAPEKRYVGLIVGGPGADRKEYEAKARWLGLGPEQVRFTGDVDASRVPAMLSACDVLAMPFPDFPHYRHHMSPLKMFEYMAAGKIIVTSDLPTVRDVLSEETAVFCGPGSAASLAEALRFIQEHPKEAHKRALSAKVLVANHTWEERMRRILNAAKIVPL
jgi:glycosyltransferase involved in cell wall biosynthesis